MIEDEHGTATAITSVALTAAAAVLVVGCLFKDLILATLKPVGPAKTWGRNWFLRLTGREAEAYVGRHRLELVA